MEILELIAHPVRLRIIHAMRGDRVLTTGQLGALLPDVSKAMLYRHVDLLASAGILEIAEEQRVRGAVERKYRLRDERAVISADDFKSLTPQDHRRGFATAIAVLLAEFNAYLDHEGADPVVDLVGYRQHSVWLTDDELTELIGQMRAAIVPALANQPTPGRKRYMLSPIMFPLESAGGSGHKASSHGALCPEPDGEPPTAHDITEMSGAAVRRCGGVGGYS